MLDSQSHFKEGRTLIRDITHTYIFFNLLYKTVIARLYSFQLIKCDVIYDKLFKF